jgi:hypothetical protein
MTMDVRSLLKVMVDQESSDLYLTVDAPPIYRIHGVTQQTDAPPFTNEQLEALALALMRGQQRSEFEEKMEMNLALYYKELGRFRVNIFRQKGNVGLVQNQPDCTGLPEICPRLGARDRSLCSSVPSRENLRAAAGCKAANQAAADEKCQDGRERPYAVSYLRRPFARRPEIESLDQSLFRNASAGWCEIVADGMRPRDSYSHTLHDILIFSSMLSSGTPDNPRADARDDAAPKSRRGAFGLDA